jgi:hypothetical protein
MALDGVGDADAADQQRGEADQVRNWVKRLMVRSSCGEALSRLRISQPASGRRFARSSTSGRGALVGARSGSFTR